jgi:hypothetical protein
MVIQVFIACLIILIWVILGLHSWPGHDLAKMVGMLRWNGVSVDSDCDSDDQDWIQSGFLLESKSCMVSTWMIWIAAMMAWIAAQTLGSMPWIGALMSLILTWMALFATWMVTLLVWLIFMTHLTRIPAILCRARGSSLTHQPWH